MRQKTSESAVSSLCWTIHLFCEVQKMSTRTSCLRHTNASVVRAHSRMLLVCEV
jgi:hypothetical protein